jgi:AcrR family transcriptional regulator
MSLTSGTGSQRRRGAALEEALLDAAWAELTERGYEAFTIDGAAARAATSRAVFYRRWPSKHELVQAAVVREVGNGFVTPPDTGSLRGDVIALLRQFNERRVQLAASLFAHLGSMYRDTGTSIADLRALIPGGRASIMDDVIQRAVARGEIETGQVSERIAHLPMDLLRHDVLMTLQPITEQAIEEIVDTIFLPLVHGNAAGHRR